MDRDSDVRCESNNSVVDPQSRIITEGGSGYFISGNSILYHDLRFERGQLDGLGK